MVLINRRDMICKLTSIIAKDLNRTEKNKLFEIIYKIMPTVAYSKGRDKWGIQSWGPINTLCNHLKTRFKGDIYAKIC